MPSLLRQLQDVRSTEKVGSISNKMEPNSEEKTLNSFSKGKKTKAVSSSSKAREDAHHEFLLATAKLWDKAYTDHKILPNLESALASFKEIYPRYSDTLLMESLRVQEYAHLEESGRVCLDYCGFGLFSYLQQFEDWYSASFALSSLSVNLCSHALFGAADEGTVECDIRKRIMDYLNIQDSEYSMVFTASRGAAFKLLADAYPFATSRRLVTMYDYESESLGWLVQRAREKGAKVSEVSFKWPSLRIVSTKLRKLLVAKGSRRKRGSPAGLFVFPVQSRVSGAKYSYQWMSLAQQNKWHVLLDASALGPKDMDSLGLSMFKPDFIIASFYKVFGADPSGFGCLFIKNTAMQHIQNQSGAAAPGIVRVIPFPTEWTSSGSSNGSLEDTDGLAALVSDDEPATDFEFPKSSQLIQGVPSFSGPILGFDKFSSPEDRAQGFKPTKGEDDDDSSVCDSVEEASRSPVFSEEGTEMFCLDGGASPAVSAGRMSMSDDQFSGPFSGPIHNPVCDGQLNAHGPRGLWNPLYEDNSCIDNVSKAKEGVKDHASASSENSGECLAVMDVSQSSKLEGNSMEGSSKLSQNAALKAKMARDVPEGNGHSSSVQSKVLNEAENGESFANGSTSGCRKFENSSHCSEVEIVKDSNGVAITDETGPKHVWNRSDSAICRETEGDFRLLGKRDGIRLMLGCTFSPLMENSKDTGSFGGGRSSFVSAEHAADSYHSQGGSSGLEDNEHARSNEDADEQDQYDEREPEVLCRSLDHADMLGLNKTTLRHRYLINWLVSSFLQLQHPGTAIDMSLVHVYGPQIKYDRGASVAFNLYDCHGKLIHPELVQMLADKNNISLSIGFFKNLQVPDDDLDLHAFEDNRKASRSSKALSKGRGALRIEVVTAALSILSTFEDVYKLWVFVAMFLDAEFMSKELSSNQDV